MSEKKQVGKKKIVKTSRKVKTERGRGSHKGKRFRKRSERVEMLFGRDTFKWMLIGLGLIAVGLFLMLGGHMPSAEVWDDSLIYNHRRITIAPAFILAGILLQFYAILKK